MAREKKAQPPRDRAAPGDARRDRLARRSREETQAVAEIGPIPRVKSARRKNACRRNLERFLATYFPHSTGLTPFSPDHKRIIARLQRCILEGGRTLNAVYRGFAKTTIGENSALWAVLYGHRRYVAIFGSDKTAAVEINTAIRLELETNDLLFDDFPEVCFPVRALEGKPQRCDSQTHKGERTHIRWSKDQVVLPTIPKSPGSGAVITARGLLAGTRGMKRKSATGENARPDLLLIDDPQTDQSARTPAGVRKRLHLIRSNLLKLGGHRTKLAVNMNATVIERDDLIDELLTDRRKHAAWQPERVPFVTSWSKAHETHWKNYADLRTTYNGGDVNDQKRAQAEATAYYESHRAEMDAGCVVSWDSCFDPETEISAIQHAYNALIDDGEESFASEMQQQPLRAENSAIQQLLASDLRSKLNRVPRGTVPVGRDTLTAFIDVQQSCLYWLVAGWGPQFDGDVVDRNAFPDQASDYFSLANLRVTFGTKYPGKGLEGAIYAALDELVAMLALREWPRQGGGSVRLRRILVDAGDSTDVVYQFCRQSAHAGLLYPSHGHGITAGRAPMGTWKPKPTDIRRGPNWILTRGDGRRGVPHVVYDTNFWKSFAAARLATAIGDRGSVALYGEQPRAHELLADHLTSEFRVETFGHGRRVEEWKLHPHRPDNHWWDGLVGSAVAASIEGCALPEWGPSTAPARKTSRDEYERRRREFEARRGF